jgi:hypothetical protein
MTDSGSNQSSQPGDVARELQELGRNLASIMREAWESEERKKLQEEIRSGVEDLSRTVNQAVTDLRSSPTGQRVQEEVQDLKDRIRTGEVDTKIREEFLSVLKTLNRELEKASKKSQTPPEPPVA